MALPCLKNARRIFAIVSTTSIPTSASKNHGSQCGPSVPGSRLEADHPEKGVLFACRFTPFGGNAPALTALLGGQVEVSVASLPSSIESIRTGKLHGLAVTSATRSEALPDLP